MKNLFQLLLVALLVACAPGVPKQYIQPDQMEDILYDYHMGKALADQIAVDRTVEYKRRLYFYAVLDKYGKREADFDSSMIYYYSHADKLRDIYNNVSARMDETANVIGASMGSEVMVEYGADGDTANVWNNSTMIMLMPAPPYNRMDFVVEVDSTYETGDSFQLNFMTEFFTQDNADKEAVGYLAIRYENDSVVGFNRTTANNTLGQIKVPSNRKLAIKDIWGYFYMGGGADEERKLRILTISNIQLLRMHAKEEADSLNEESETDAPNVGTGPVPASEGDSIKVMPDSLKLDTLRRNSNQERVKAKTKKPKKAKNATTGKGQVKPVKPATNVVRKKRADE